MNGKEEDGRFECDKSTLEQHAIVQMFTCTECGKTFRHKSDLDQHAVVHTAIQFPCSECGRRFAQHSSLSQHIKECSCVKIQTVKHTCTVCGMLFRSEWLLKRHATVHTDHQCTLCGKSFLNQVTLKRHALRCAGVKEHKCSKCGNKYAHKTSMTRHANTCGKKNVCKPTHDHNWKNRLQYVLRVHDNVRKLHFQCKKCEERFDSFPILDQHLQLCIDKLPTQNDSDKLEKFPCTICGEKFEWKSLSDHMKIHSRDTSRIDIYEKKFQADNDGRSVICPKCKTKFECPSSMEIHFWMCFVSDKSLHKCQHCDKTFPDKVVFYAHMAAHHRKIFTDENTFHVDDETKSKVQKSNVASHSKTRDSQRQKTRKKETRKSNSQDEIATQASSSKTRVEQPVIVSILECVICGDEPGVKSTLVDRFKPQSMGMRYVCPKCDINLAFCNNLDEYFRTAALLMHSW